MNLPKLNKYFPASNAMAELYNGWLESPFFKRRFDGSRQEQIEELNKFLSENDFDFQLKESEFDDEGKLEIGNFIFVKNVLSPNMILLIYQQPLMADPLDSLYQLVDSFRQERDWKQFHNSKDLAMAISSESGELLDLYLWDRAKDVSTEKVSEELADIFLYLLLLAKNQNINLFDAAIEKILTNDKKYPVDKSKGIAKKYNQL